MKTLNRQQYLASLEVGGGDCLMFVLCIVPATFLYETGLLEFQKFVLDHFRLLKNSQPAKQSLSIFVPFLKIAQIM